MASMAPPPWPPPVALDDGDPVRRFQFRVWLVTLTLATVLITTWLMLLDPVMGILGLVTAKHVLVAILLRRLQINNDQPEF
jgi:hypothetical protein